MRRIRLTLSYDGTAYFGWQMQPNVPTIQGVLERVLSELAGETVKVLGSGRTDAGVHALGQVAAFNLRNPIPVENLKRAVNRLLPRDIRVVEAAEAAPEFHPRHHAARKTYRYRIYRELVCPPFERLYVWHHPFPLDEERMRIAAELYKGVHNFRAFAAADDRYTEGTDMRREVYSSRLWRDDYLLIYEVCGSGFLKHMVRNLVGGLLEVGSGTLASEDLTTMLRNGERHLGIRTVPASGLFLVNVEYKVEHFGWICPKNGEQTTE